MYGKKVKLRFLFLTLILASVVLSVFLILQSLEENVVYFQSPSDIKKLERLRKNLRQRLLSSPLFDANKFVSNFEKSLMRVWQEHKQLIRASKP